MAAFKYVVLCEGREQGIDVLLLEAARFKVEQSQGSPIAREVQILPAGGKGELVAALKSLRSLPDSMGRQFFAIRDRDFLRRQVLDEYRIAALQQVEDPRSWPLTRHCIESYLLDPEILAAAGVGEAVIGSIGQMAKERLCYDAARSAVEVGNVLLRKVRAELVDEPFALRGESDAIAAAKASMEKLRSKLASDRVEGLIARMESEVRGDIADFERDGPPAWRVDGKELLQSVAKASGIHDLASKLTKLAVEEPPSDLVEDMNLFLSELKARIEGAAG